MLLDEASVNLTQCGKGKRQLSLIGLNYTSNPFCSRCQYIKVISETQMQKLIHNFNPSSCAVGYRSGNYNMQKLLKVASFLIAFKSSTVNSKHLMSYFGIPCVRTKWIANCLYKMMEGVQHFTAGEKHVTHTDFPSVAAYLDSAKLKTRQHATAEKTKCDVHLISRRGLSHATKRITSYCKIGILYGCVYIYICIYDIYTHIYCLFGYIVFLHYRDNLVWL